MSRNASPDPEGAAAATDARWAEVVERCPAGVATIVSSAFDPDPLWDNMARMCGYSTSDALHIRAYIGRTYYPDGLRRPS